MWLCFEDEDGLVAVAHFDTFKPYIWPQKDSDGMMDGLKELCIDLEDTNHSYVAHEREFCED